MVIRRVRSAPRPPRDDPPRGEAPVAAGRAGDRPVLLVSAALAVGTLLVYAGALGHGFLEYDDQEYVTNNPMVRDGLTGRGVGWAATAVYAANWHPLTWVSLQFDAEVFGLRPWGFHLTNLLVHAAATVFVFLAFRRMTGAVARSAVVAALFAVHPLHVESVAWVAERKDVLSGFFWFLTLWAYARYAEAPGRGRYAAVAAAYALGALAKPMVVTLPCVLLLLDYWPLGRLRAGGRGASRLVAEKLPLFAISAACAGLTWYAQQGDNAIQSVTAYPPAARVGNALVAYAAYLGQAAVPHGLAAHYPHPGTTLPVWQPVAAGVGLAAVTVAAWRYAAAAPYLPVGWLWFLGTLVPVIGLVQVGDQARADRYTYVPLVGVFAAAVWGAADLADRAGLGRLKTAAAAAALVACAGLTVVQVRTWRDDVALWGQAVRATTGNVKAHKNLGRALAYRGRTGESVVQFRAALALAPDDAETHNNLGCALAIEGRMPEAVVHFREALRVNPADAGARANLDRALGQVRPE